MLTVEEGRRMASGTDQNQLEGYRGDCENPRVGRQGEGKSSVSEEKDKGDRHWPFHTVTKGQS